MDKTQFSTEAHEENEEKEWAIRGEVEERRDDRAIDRPEVAGPMFLSLSGKIAKAISNIRTHD